MPLTFTKGDIFESKCDWITNPVNCVGTMGAGLAKQFAKRYPDYLAWYKAQCANNLIKVGMVSQYRSGSVQILSFPTKEHWKNPSKLEWIWHGLVDLRMLMDTDAIGDTVALPALGCGHGGLDFSVVKQMIEQELGPYPVVVYEGENK